jgi:hypothetical protein
MLSFAVVRGTRGPDLGGRRLGSYRLERLLGTGAFGSVYLARHEHLGVLRAVKVLRAGLAEVPEIQDRFLHEARTAAGLSHPCIVPVYDFGTDEGIQYIVMEYVESVTLARHVEPLEPAGRLTDLTVLAAVRDVAAALDYAHARGVLHRDLKPANVLVRRSEQRALLTDFGVAKVLSESDLTQAGLTVGSYAYMSPEQCSGAPDGLTTRSDVYAFAAVLFEIASGAPPFGRGVAAVGGHLHQPVPSVAAAAPGFADALAPVLGRGLAKLPEDRYQTAGDLAAAFLEAAAEPTVIRPAVLPAAGAASLPPPPGPPAPQAPPARPAPAAPAAPDGRLRLLAAAGAALLALSGVVALAVARDRLPRPAPQPSALPAHYPIANPKNVQRGRVGDAIEVKDGSADVRVVVVEASPNDAGSAQAPLADPGGDRFVDVRVRLENLAPDSLTYGAYNWWLTDSAGYVYPDLPPPAAPPLPADVSELPPGQSVEGYVAFEVPRSAKGLEVWGLIDTRGVRVPIGQA